MAGEAKSLHAKAPELGRPHMGVNTDACPYCGAKGHAPEQPNVVCEHCGGSGSKAVMEKRRADKN